MTFYYDPGQPMLFSLTVCSRTQTMFEMVFRRFEFWFFVAMHIGLVVLVRYGYMEPYQLSYNEWEALGYIQFFLTFFLTFYNGQCFARYLQLYELSVGMIDGIMLFMHEVVVSIPYAELEKHRITAVKYVLAMTYVYFIGTVKGTLTKSDWEEIVARGLLTNHEAELLQVFPAKSTESILVLSAWAMQIVDLALSHPMMWGPRSMRIGHTHNRAKAHLLSTLRYSNEIQATLALPIPCAYFNLMNTVIAFNVLILCFVAAGYQNYFTIFPFAIAMLFFMGLREISAALADPFGTDDVDFPVDRFIDHCFDGSVCVLETFRSTEATDTQALLDRVIPFTNQHVRAKITNDVLYQDNYSLETGNVFAWSMESPLSLLSVKSEHPTKILSTLLSRSMSNVVQTTPEEAEDIPARVGSINKNENAVTRSSSFRQFVMKHLKVNQTSFGNVMQKLQEAPRNTKAKHWEKRRSTLQKQLSQIVDENTKLEIEIANLEDVIEYDKEVFARIQEEKKEEEQQRQAVDLHKRTFGNLEKNLDKGGMTDEPSGEASTARGLQAIRHHASALPLGATRANRDKDSFNFDDARDLVSRVVNLDWGDHHQKPWEQQQRHIMPNVQQQMQQQQMQQQQMQRPGDQPSQKKTQQQQQQQQQS